MKLQIYSDLHMEFGPFAPPEIVGDIVVLAGDTRPGPAGARWALEAFTDMPVIYIAGNHEYYGFEVDEVAADIVRLARGSRLHFLNPGQVVIGGVRFIGATLWTDFSLFGAPQAAMDEAQRAMNDYRRIGLRRLGRYRPLTPADTVALHEKELNYLTSCLKSGFEGPTVVVSHHAPSGRVLPEAQRSKLYRAAYCSDLEALIQAHQPDLWVHGHTHFAGDYYLDRTRVVCNPRGYITMDPTPGFKPDLTIEVPE